jgi:hypothetical protein
VTERMSQATTRVSSGMFLVGLVAERIDAIRQKATAFRPGESVDDEWGRSESLDPDNVGDIADEGAGHRG